MARSWDRVYETAAAMIAKLKAFSEDFQNYLADGAVLQEDEKEELRWRRLSYWMYFFFIIVVGVPIWHLTTTPYRASLPHFEDHFREHLKDIFSPSSAEFSSKDIHGSKPGDVWNQMALFPAYNVHFVFVHDVPSYESTEDYSGKKEIDETQKSTAELLNNVRKFAGIFHDNLQLNISAEHFWDFSLTDFLLNHLSDKEEKSKYLHLSDKSGKPRENVLIINNAQVPALTTEIDRLSTPPIGSEPLVKVVVFYSDKTVQFFDNEMPVHGLTVASWGGFVCVSRDTRTNTNMNSMSQEVFAILRIQLGIDKASKSGSKFGSSFFANSHKSVNKVQEDVMQHKLALTMENLLLTAHFINSLHDLKDKLEDLVISEEVAQLARASYENFFVSYKALTEEKRIDAPSSSSARIMAERAVTHPSLLEFLNFPSDQKYGIYVPL
ncbi:phosphatidylinositol-glycan biosynthesis class S protein [Ditylenchus destructor]|nr:phosphatidylinositol-glycan biosynthesis class S protein [Ditylenchus destructor]